MTSKTSIRRAAIIRLASEEGSVNVEDLAAKFGVTASTIRRDLALLTESGKLARTYGGVMAVSHLAETPLLERQRENLDEKRAIANLARQRIQDESTIYLDSGSTTTLLARYLPKDAKITVVTSSMSVLQVLQTRTDIAVISLGGRLRRVSNGFVGSLAEIALERITFDAAFLSADAVSAGRGLCEAELDQTRMKELIARQSGQVYVIADSSKLGGSPFSYWTNLSGEWELITDSGATADQLNEFQSHGITTHIAELS